ncbi:DUF2461 domain-containing protein [Amycolatopsis acidiphila]|uniref:DUF2461 domain-containing protein n=1 Tax=Amycolatopsis acidiphila TaxID=715473 RepID=A0A558A7I6_9PSEU|nr:DUF2461 domain-containing protein [Amycolatopsis acidiphila]TVT20229.1 DUF2461 domain-containing protein [Amycolatopsis acidiphila]UIJ58220.1 DUF2461 domain-containing protein [Amycolatopsis acidiphila]
MTFAGFGEHAVEFYDGLLADNSKPYWEDNLKIYREHVRAPMEALLAELVGEFAPGFGEGKVFRPHRDVRFAKDKSPYKTHCGAVIEQGRGGGAYYVELSSEGLRVGGGCFHLQSDQLTRFREAVDSDVHGHTLGGILGKLRKSGWQLTGDALRTKPRGFADDHPRLELLKYRSLYAIRAWEPDDTLHERGCLDRVRKAWRQVRDFNEWARDHVGLSEKPRR